MSKITRLIAAAPLLLLAACASVHHSPSPQLAAAQSWAVLPFTNHTETPFAGEKAQSMTAGLLRARGAVQVREYIPAVKNDPLPGEALAPSLSEGLDWARQAHVRYALTGTVEEWRYKVGLDGEPAVGLTLQLWDVDKGQVVWSAVGSKSGWSGAALSGVAQNVIGQMLDGLRIAR